MGSHIKNRMFIIRYDHWVLIAPPLQRQKTHHMRIISWNIQDGKKPEALAKLIFLSNKFKPYIMFILETMTSHQNSLNFLKALHFDHKLIIDPQPLWRFLGGLEQCHYRCLKPLYYS